MRKSFYTCLCFLPLLLLLTSCEENGIHSEIMTLDNDFIATEINDQNVRFDAFRFDVDQSHFRPASPATGEPAELLVSRSTADGSEDITLLLRGLELNRIDRSESIRFGRSEAGEDQPVEFIVKLKSWEDNGSAHCPTLTAHEYALTGSVFIDEWSAETGILEGRFEAEELYASLRIDAGTNNRIILPAEWPEKQMLRNGSFRIWVRQL